MPGKGRGMPPYPLKGENTIVKGQHVIGRNRGKTKVTGCRLLPAKLGPVARFGNRINIAPNTGMRWP